MPLQNIKNRIHQSIEELFASAEVDELAGDFDNYSDKMQDIATFASFLGIKTEFRYATLVLVQDEAQE